MLGASIGLLPREAEKLTLPELEALVSAEQARFDRFCRVMAWMASLAPHAVASGISMAFEKESRLRGWDPEDLLKVIPGYKGKAE